MQHAPYAGLVRELDGLDGLEIYAVGQSGLLWLFDCDN